MHVSVRLREKARWFTSQTLGRPEHMLEWEAADKLDALEARVKELEVGYEEAIQDVADWGAYAGEYFQEKHDLTGCLATHKKRLGKEQGHND